MKIYQLGVYSLLAFICVNTATAASRVDETRSIPPDGLVQVDNLAGSVEITTWDQAEVNIQGELGDDVEKLEISESSNGVRIRVKNHQNRRNIDESHLRIRVPVSASVEADSVSADISLKGSNGSSIVFNSVSGDLSVTGEPGRVDLESVSGDVAFGGHTARASFQTVSGEIEVEGVEAEVRVSTVSGDTELTGSSIGSGRFETVSGDLRLKLDVADGGRLDAESMSGDVILSLPASQQAEFSATTFSGDIRTEFGDVEQKSRGPGSSLSYRSGSNGTSIEIGSFSGDIRITEQ